MDDMRPQMQPGATPGAQARVSAESTPSAMPPAGAGTIGIVVSPVPSMAGVADAAPSLRPAEEIAAGIGAWQSNKRINGLWSINQNRNSWVHIDGVGWRKLANTSDTAIVALTMLGAHAREKASVVNYRDESDGMIHEMYIW